MSKEKAIANLIPVFRHYGYEGATLSRLSQATGLSKSSLYHHFPGGKEEMAAEVLEYVNYCFKKTILVPLQTQSKPIERLQLMCRNLAEFYGQGQESCLLNAITFGDGNDRFHSHIQQALKTWIEELVKVLVEAAIEPELAQLRAEEAVMLIQGALVLSRGLGDTTPFQRILTSLPERLLSDSKSI